MKTILTIMALSVTLAMGCQSSQPAPKASEAKSFATLTLLFVG